MFEYLKILLKSLIILDTYFFDAGLAQNSSSDAYISLNPIAQFVVN